MNSAKSALAVVIAVMTLAAFAAEVKVPLLVIYPKPAFFGTPKPVKLENLEPSPDRPPELLVSPRTALLSRGRPVSASDSLPIIGELSYVTDGDKTGIDGTVVELGPGRQWVQIDLGAPARIAAVAVWHFHSEGRAYHDVVVRISDDATFAGTATTIFNNDHDDSSALGRGKDRPYGESRFGRLIDARGTSGRYVRLYSNGNTSDELNHYCEVEVFGERADPVVKSARR